MALLFGGILPAGTPVGRVAVRESFAAPEGLVGYPYAREGCVS